MSGPEIPHLFVSYGSVDRDRVVPIVRELQHAGYNVWFDVHNISGGANYGEEIVEAIKNCATMIIACTSAALESRNVRQEIQLAWKYQRPYLPLLIEPTIFPSQIEYWLEGYQWVEVLDHPVGLWLPHVLGALEKLGVPHTDRRSAQDAPTVLLRQPLQAAVGATPKLPQGVGAAPSVKQPAAKDDSESRARRSRAPLLAAAGAMVVVLLLGAFLVLGPLRGGAGPGPAAQQPSAGSPAQSTGDSPRTAPMGAPRTAPGVTATVPSIPMGGSR